LNASVYLDKIIAAKMTEKFVNEWRELAEIRTIL
jgi:hypothetical protein